MKIVVLTNLEPPVTMVETKLKQGMSVPVTKHVKDVKQSDLRQTEQKLRKMRRRIKDT